MNKLIKLFLWSKKNIRNLPSILALIMTQVFCLSVFSAVSAASSSNEPFLNSAKTYQEAYKATVYRAGDTMFTGTTNTAGRVSSFDDAAAFLYGTNAYEDLSEGTGVTSEDLSESTKIGMINTLDNQVTALLYNAPGVDIPSHLARQWIPGADSSSTSVLATDTGYTHFKNLGVEEIWIMFRDIAYMGFVLILIATGFMIMFRSKIGGQTAVTVMNSLPSILVGLILVTFSFAIVGFAIDIARLVTALFSNILKRSLPELDIAPLSGPMEMARYAFTGSMEGTWTNWASSSGGIISSIGTIFANVGGFFMKLVLSVILGFVVLYASFKLFFVLIMAYVKILMDLVMGPIYILVGSLPGGGHSITDWIKRLLINSLTFPVVFFIINLFRYIGTSDVTNPLGGNFVGFMGGGEDIGDPMIQLKGVIVIAGYFIAAGAPSIIQDMFQLRESPGASKAAQDIQKSASKIPLIGGMFAG